MKTKIVKFILLLFLCAQVTAQNNRLSEEPGKMLKFERQGSVVRFIAQKGVMSLSAVDASTLRVRVTRANPVGDSSFAVQNPVSSVPLRLVSGAGETVELATDSLRIQVLKNPLRLTVMNAKGEVLCRDDRDLGVSWWGNEVTCYKKLHPDEKFIGLGEKNGPLNRRGEYYQHWNSDFFGYSASQDPLYSTIPFFIGVHDSVCYGLFVDNTNRTFVNFGGGADNEQFHFGAVDGEMNYYILGRSTVPGILQAYTALTGRTPMPPLWSLGFQQSRWGYDNPEQFLQMAQTFRDKKLPADVLVCDINYMDHYKIFTWSDAFGNVKNFVDKMRDMNFELVTIVDPGIKIEPGYRAYDEGVKNDYFVHYPNGKLYTGSVWPGRCHFPDFLKPEVRNWWGGSFKASHTDNGIRGFWNDMNEPAVWGRELPNLIEFGSGAQRQTLHSVRNVYGLLMARATYEGTRKLLAGERPFVLTRAAYAGIQKYSAMWTGDNVSSDEHMLLGFRMLNSMAVSGVPFVGTDIGGFLGNPSPDLFVRWLSLGVFSPLMRNHTSMNYNYREPWLFGEENTRRIRSVLELRYRLLPHLYSAFYQAHTTGMPVNRMLPVAYTFDNTVYQPAFENQFLFGDGMMVCPVASAASVLKVYFPGHDRWYRWSDDRENYAGGSTVNVDAPVTDLPVFVRAGAIVPMQSVVQSTRDAGDGILYLHVWKGTRTTTYTYYEDDGHSYNYEKGAYSRREIRYDPAAQTVALSAVDGSYRSRFAKVQVVLHGYDTSKTPEANWSNDAMTISLR